MLIVITLLTFANSWPDTVDFDDKDFVGPDRRVKLDSYGEAFSQDIWQHTDTASGLYRPVLQIFFEAENRLFGDWLEGFHLVNIFLHLAATLLLFGFLRHLVTRTDARTEHADLVALLPALIFAVHPAHTEVVNSIFNGSSIIVSIFAISSLWWLLSRLETRPAQAWLCLAHATAPAPTATIDRHPRQSFRLRQAAAPADGCGRAVVGGGGEDLPGRRGDAVLGGAVEG